MAGDGWAAVNWSFPRATHSSEEKRTRSSMRGETFELASRLVEIGNEAEFDRLLGGVLS
jgi:hypothetical protein